MNDHYNANGPFKGINWAGVIAIIIGSVVSLFFVQVSWYASLFPTGLAYYYFMKNMKKAAVFRTGTIFE